MTAGARLEGVLVVDAKEPIPRAERIDLVFRTSAWAGYGSGKSRRVYRRQVFLAPLRVELTEDTIPAGVHRYPFGVDAPPWLPPGLAGPDCGIVHEIDARIDVDWAIDPKQRLVPRVVMPEATGFRQTVTTRSPAGWHESIVLEVTLTSNVIAQDEPLEGQIALRAGHAARFDAVELSFGSTVTIPMGRGDLRRGAATMIRIPAEQLRSGEAVPFLFPPTLLVPPTYRTGFIDHDTTLVVSVDIPWAIDPSFAVLVTTLPAGSVIHGETRDAPVGGERLRRISGVMAAATGLRQGRPPALVEGSHGLVAFRVSDAPRDGRLGIDADVTFPDVDLGIELRPLGMLEGFRSSPLLPDALGHRYLLRASPEDARPAPDEDALRAFFAAVLGDLAGAEEIRLSDHHLGAHFPLPNDEDKRMVAVAQIVAAKAKVVGEAIARLPFPAPVAAARPTWEAVAAEQSAALVPSGPSLHGLVFRARVLTGEERSATAALRTVFTKSGPQTHVDVDLRAAPLPKAAWAELEAPAPGERLRAVRAVFPVAHMHAQGGSVTLEQRGFASDPRPLLSAIETFFAWVLEARGERRVDSPYR